MSNHVPRAVHIHGQSGRPAVELFPVIVFLLGNPKKICSTNPHNVFRSLLTQALARVNQLVSKLFATKRPDLKMWGVHIVLGFFVDVPCIHYQSCIVMRKCASALPAMPSFSWTKLF